jgi:hypothetical protein
VSDTVAFTNPKTPIMFTMAGFFFCPMLLAFGLGRCVEEGRQISDQQALDSAWKGIDSGA